MLLSEIVSILDAEPLNGEMDLGIDIQSAFASDLMSDVLALARPGVLMITGLTNIQIMRTASMIDIPAVVFVRGKNLPGRPSNWQENLASLSSSRIKRCLRPAECFSRQESNRSCALKGELLEQPGLLCDRERGKAS